MLLGVNIDHVATLRQARYTTYPAPVEAALAAEEGGADSITLHLREDRRHIQEEDVLKIQEQINIPINLEMALTEEMLRFAEHTRPDYCCLVPEKREELTTEGGLDALGNQHKIQDGCMRLADAGIRVSLFIDAFPMQLEAAAMTGASCIELHTGHFASATDKGDRLAELAKIKEGVILVSQLGLVPHAGHGLNYNNAARIAAIPKIQELNIGHAIIAKALFTGMVNAVKEMKRLIHPARLDYLPPN